MHKINTKWMSESSLWEKLIKYAHDLPSSRLWGRMPKGHGASLWSDWV